MRETGSIGRAESVRNAARSAEDREAAAALQRAASGDVSAMMELYDRYGTLLLSVAMRVTGSRSDAEEVVQDTMARAWSEAATFDPTRGTASTWLLTLARNRSIDLVRARGRRNKYEEAFSDETRPEPASSPEAATSLAQRVVAVRHALDALTPDQRSVLDLAYFGGLSHSEIAVRLSQPLGTVKTRILQAVRRLREELSAVDLPDPRR